MAGAFPAVPTGSGRYMCAPGGLPDSRYGSLTRVQRRRWKSRISEPRQNGSFMREYGDAGIDAGTGHRRAVTMDNPARAAADRFNVHTAKPSSCVTPPIVNDAGPGAQGKRIDGGMRSDLWFSRRYAQTRAEGHGRHLTGGCCLEPSPGRHPGSCGDASHATAPGRQST